MSGGPQTRTASLVEANPLADKWLVNSKGEIDQFEHIVLTRHLNGELQPSINLVRSESLLRRFHLWIRV